MASSGTYAFNPAYSQITLAAYERIQIRAPSIRQEHMTSARTELNLLLVTLGNLQPNLWEVEQGSIDLIAGTASYSVAARTVMILDAWVTTTTGSTSNDRYVTPISRTEYASLSNKLTQGSPTQYWFDRILAPVVLPWPVPDSGGPYTFNYFFCSQMQDAGVTGGETPNLPYLWLDCLVAGLAHRFARIYKPELEAIREKDYNRAWEIAAAQNTENVNFSIAPAIGGYYRG